MSKFSAILAIDDKGGIGKDNGLPWAGTPIATADARWFASITAGCVVIMGRRTWESIGSCPLNGRINIVLSSKNKSIVIESTLTSSPVVHNNSFNTALAWCKDNVPIDKRIFVIGGAGLYHEAFAHSDCVSVLVTHIRGDYGCDTKINNEILDANFKRVETQTLSFGAYKYPSAVDIYVRLDYPGKGIGCHGRWPDNNPSEGLYLDLLRELMSAPSRSNRTSIATNSLFGRSLRFPLCDEHAKILPMITTRYISFKAIYHELIWFLRGLTDTKYLLDNNIHIWDGNSARAFLNSRGLKDLPQGSVGPIYGAQWRNWNGVGIDQIANLIAALKTDPYSRRHVVTAWNPEKIDQMSLPACHYSFQMYVEPDPNGLPRWLSCMVNMRSGDCFHGVPFNICSYALLSHMIATICGFTAKELVINICDAHIYAPHIPAVEKQIMRKPLSYPCLEFSGRVYEKKDLSIDDFAYHFTYDDMIVTNYFPQPAIKSPMVI